MMSANIVRSESDSSGKWSFFCQKLPRVEVVYFTQVLLIYFVVLACVVNLSLGLENQALWSSLLSGCLGYLLPSPSFSNKRKQDESLLPNTAEQ